MVEMDKHPFMVGTQFHPEFLSRPTIPHPLFRAFVGLHAAGQIKVKETKWSTGILRIECIVFRFRIIW
ncbi:MAG: hypothetical protein CM1200mP3_12690 [Chloroflexota bacterium]|nr:MAG: hypothetical protein CM1200mP3_12690 [Chloroflexota bacterium]